MSRWKDFSLILRRLIFFCIPTSKGRTKIIKSKSFCRFRHVGEHLFWQPRLLPYQCQYISLGDNVKVAAGVDFITHDVISYMLNDIDGCDKYRALVGCIEIGNNVMLGANVVIMPNIKIGSNVIVGAGAVVTKNIPDNTVYAGVPARFLMTFDDFCEKRKRINTYVGMSDEELWNQYEKEHYE